ncbi:hypothetical protein BVRB_024110, partial [Beta vulgaris subsp. vulgaris]
MLGNPGRPKTNWIFQAFRVGCPIRRSMDQSSFAAPHGFSQRITSFFACACQGIHQMPLSHFFVLIANAHHSCFVLANPTSSLALKGVPKPTMRAHLHMPHPISRPSLTICERQMRLPFTTTSNDAIDVFDRSDFGVTPSNSLQPVIRPASRDQIRYRAVRQR